MEAVRAEFVRYHRPDRGDRGLRQALAQLRLAAARLRHLEQAARLTRTGQRDRIDPSPGHLFDRGENIVVGSLGVVDVRQHGVDRGALRRDGADQRAMILVGIELQPDAVACEVDARQHLGDALRGRLLGGLLRLQADLAQRPAGFRTAGVFSCLSECCDEFYPQARLRGRPSSGGAALRRSSEPCRRRACRRSVGSMPRQVWGPRRPRS